MNGRAWTSDDDARLLRLLAAGTSYTAIGVALERSDTSIWSRMGVLGISRANAAALAPLTHQFPRGGPRTPRPRLCLCCRKPFPSAHAGNRLCSRCRGRDTSPYALAL